MTRLALLLALTACTAAPPPPVTAPAVTRAAPLETLPASLGGQWQAVEAVALHRFFMGQQARITGTCASACTANLISACVTPSAQLGFHGPSIGGQPITDPAIFEAATRQMAAAYPGDLALWFMSGPRYRADLLWISGTEAHGLGVPLC